MMLELKNICKTYTQGKLDVPVLKDISLSVEEGEYVAIMGPSGSGKTTLMNIIGCLDSPTSGEYFLEGKDIAQNSDSKMSDVRLHSIGFVFQSFYLLSRQSALENVALPLLYAGVRRKERLEIARKALERVGLGDRVNFKPTQLSGGQCQRVAIARAIVNGPKILLADEPTGALDTKSGEQIMEIFQRLNDEGVTIVMITHEPEIAAHAKRILHIRDGQLLEAQPAKKAGPSLPPDIIPPGEFHIGHKKPEGVPQPDGPGGAPLQKGPQAPVAPVQRPVQPAPQGEAPRQAPKEPLSPAPARPPERPAPPPVEQAGVSRAREKSNGPRHAAGKDAPAYRPKAQRPSQGPRHGNWAPAPQAAVQRPAAEPAPMELTAGSALYAEVTALLEQEASPRREASRRAPDPAAAKAPARKTAAPPQKSTPPAEGPQPRSGSFGAAIPIELGSLFPLGRKPQGKPGESPLVPRTEF